MNDRGALIVFEGIDGTGKSTQIGLLSRYLKDRGYDVVETREPTDSSYGQEIRKLYSNRSSVSRQEELTLFINDRKEHVDRLLEPSIAAGKIVLSDRYYLSTAAYQGAAGLDPQEILEENERFAPQPDLAIIIELTPAESVRRIQQYRNEALNDFEQEESLARVAKVFASIDRDYIRRIDGEKNVDDVHRAIVVHVDTFLKSREV